MTYSPAAASPFDNHPGPKVPLLQVVNAPETSEEVSPPPLVRVLIADDHPVVRIGVRNLLSTHGRFSVVSETQTIAETVQRTLALLPDILLMDYYMPEGSGVEALETLRERAPGVRIVLLTGDIKAPLAVQIFQAGVRGLVLKSSLSESISVALLAVCEGDYWADGQRTRDVQEIIQKYSRPPQPVGPRVHNLTRRELDVTSLIVKGHSNRQIAQELKLSEETVKRHLSNVFEKLSISTRLELAILAIERNFAPHS
jgi:DNA-binding NarL/FixJ family response regulator